MTFTAEASDATLSVLLPRATEMVPMPRGAFTRPELSVYPPEAVSVALPVSVPPPRVKEPTAVVLVPSARTAFELTLSAALVWVKRLVPPRVSTPLLMLIFVAAEVPFSTTFPPTNTDPNPRGTATVPPLRL